MGLLPEVLDLVLACLPLRDLGSLATTCRGLCQYVRPIMPRRLSASEVGDVLHHLIQAPRLPPVVYISTCPHFRELLEKDMKARSRHGDLWASAPSARKPRLLQALDRHGFEGFPYYTARALRGACSGLSVAQLEELLRALENLFLLDGQDLALGGMADALRILAQNQCVSFWRTPAAAVAYELGYESPGDHPYERRGDGGRPVRVRAPDTHVQGVLDAILASTISDAVKALLLMGEDNLWIPEPPPPCSLVREAFSVFDQVSAERPDCERAAGMLRKLLGVMRRSVDGGAGTGEDAYPPYSYGVLIDGFFLAVNMAVSHVEDDHARDYYFSAYVPVRNITPRGPRLRIIEVWLEMCGELFGASGMEYEWKVAVETGRPKLVEKLLFHRPEATKFHAMELRKPPKMPIGYDVR